MSNFFIDRRKNSKNKSAVNRQRFLRRHRAQIKEAVAERLRKRGITDIEGGEKIGISGKDLTEPVFQHGSGGRNTHVLPGNKEFVRGDQLPRPEGGGGQGAGEGKASNQGEGMDDFVFEISQQEFLDFLFEDMALPNLTKRQLAGNEEFKRVRAGFANQGTPNNIDVLRSMRGASARRLAMTMGKRRQLRQAEAELKTLLTTQDDSFKDRIAELEEKIAGLKRRIDAVPFLDDIDIRYRRHRKEPVPVSKAVMFCLMDVSGSMDQKTKDLAKRFFILLYLFLSRNYDKTEVVFIRHHTTAKEVDEEEFFYSRETGGTVVSSALDLMKAIVEARYPVNEWNIYGAQASDGDNWPEDCGRCIEVLGNDILPLVQYYSYVEISSRGPKPLWESYQQVLQSNPQAFAMQHITGPEDIYPVFRELFGKPLEVA
ncbi:YeaH/YhbH family protein [Porticoccus sp. W117]|uniref:YeaH/YhbH family protein n=1 Tax=Porticoccus sp. W117 TaxID=3054777 RepID=UPI0025956F6F|nr:YeaH/YhbH family protein [Porticoccus sp. W117]MDM3870238.1 YeaH/YhbH family protein [Porticoccus sp. W117]